MGARIVGFMLYLAFSYGMIYLLISKPFLRRWHMKEPQVRAAILTAMVLIVGVGTVLVGPFPMVLLVVALVAFIDYVRSSEALPGGGRSNHMPSWRRMVPVLFGLIGSTRQGLTAGLAHCFRHPVFTVAQGALAGGVARLPGYHPSLARKSHGDGRDASARGCDRATAVQARHPLFTTAQGVLADGVARLPEYFRSIACKSDGDTCDVSNRGEDRAPIAQAPAGAEITGACYEFDGSDLFFVVNSVRIAKRGHPRTADAGKWILLRNDVAVFELMGSPTTPASISRR
jgi:hypothetical protein